MALKNVCISAFLAIILLTSVSYGDINILTNPGFESDGATGWLLYYNLGSIGVVTSPVRSGYFAGRCYDRQYSWYGMTQDLLGKMVIGETYTISAWARTNSSTSEYLYMYIVKTDLNGTNYYYIDSAPVSNSGWVELSGSYTLNVTGMLGGVYIWFEGLDSGIDYYIDDASVYGPQMPPPTGEINANIRHQVLEGFGASGAWLEGDVANNSDKTALYNVLFSQSGLDIYRERNSYGYDNGRINNTADIVAGA